MVPDFSVQSIEAPTNATTYYDRPHTVDGPGLVMIKSAGHDIPETLVAIDRLWRQAGQQQPVDRIFVSGHVEALYEGPPKTPSDVLGCFGKQSLRDFQSLAIRANSASIPARLRNLGNGLSHRP
ncbi:MAG: hypothetical protein V4472_24385 [Pseudomonadota bacterium]